MWAVALVSFRQCTEALPVHVLGVPPCDAKLQTMVYFLHPLRFLAACVCLMT